MLEQETDAQDRELIASAARGDRSAFQTLCARHASALYRIAARLSPAVDAEDVVQECLLAAWRGAGSFRGEAQVRTWLAQMVINGCRHRARTAVRQSGVSLDHAVEVACSHPTAEERLSRAQLGQLLSQALDGLPLELREVLLLRDVEQLAGADVARALSVSLPAMKSRLHRARLALKESMDALVAPRFTGDDL